MPLHDVRHRLDDLEILANGNYPELFVRHRLDDLETRYRKRM